MLMPGPNSPLTVPILIPYFDNRSIDLLGNLQNKPAGKCGDLHF